MNEASGLRDRQRLFSIRTVCDGLMLMVLMMVIDTPIWRDQLFSFITVGAVAIAVSDSS